MSAKLTDKQRKELKPALDNLDRAHEEFSAQLRSVLGGAGEGTSFEGTSCFDCNCGGFVRPAHGGRDRCAREGCGHPERHHCMP
jgi:hypothetical protein